MSSLTLHAIWFVVGVHFSLADLVRNGADTGYLQSAVGVGMQLRHFDAQLAARVRRTVKHKLDAVGRLRRPRLIQMPPNLVECAESVAVGMEKGWAVAVSLKCFHSQSHYRIINEARIENNFSHPPFSRTHTWEFRGSGAEHGKAFSIMINSFLSLASRRRGPQFISQNTRAGEACAAGVHKSLITRLRLHQFEFSWFCLSKEGRAPLDQSLRTWSN